LKHIYTNQKRLERGCDIVHQQIECRLKTNTYTSKEPNTRALQKSPTKEPNKRALQKSPAKETDLVCPTKETDLVCPHKTATKEPYKRAQQKSPTKEPNKRALQKSPTKETDLVCPHKSPTEESYSAYIPIIMYTYPKRPTKYM